MGVPVVGLEHTDSNLIRFSVQPTVGPRCAHSIFDNQFAGEGLLTKIGSAKSDCFMPGLAEMTNRLSETR